MQTGEVEYKPPRHPSRPDPVAVANALVVEAITRDAHEGMDDELSHVAADYCAEALQALFAARLLVLIDSRTRANVKAADAMFAVCHHYNRDAGFRAAFDARADELLKEVR